MGTETNTPKKARVVTLPNTLKNKIGSGGLDAESLFKAEAELTNNKIDFRPIAEELLDDLDIAIRNAKNSSRKDESLVEAMLYPAAQFRGQGTLFHFPLVSDIGDILIGFLETITTPVPENALEIVSAHKMAISVVISNNITDRDHPLGDTLKRSLTEARGRYYKTSQLQSSTQ
jgi:hypothetical protein